MLAQEMSIKSQKIRTISKQMRPINTHSSSSMKQSTLERYNTDININLLRLIPC
jgi:hypothetical protein